jgi:hypothetical protein
MGYVRHHSIIVTTSAGANIFQVHEKAKLIFGHLASEIIPSNLNNIYSIFIAPDGSKEGWSESDELDTNRASFIEFLESKKYSDGSNSIKYIELFYGDDEGEAKILNHN